MSASQPQATGGSRPKADALDDTLKANDWCTNRAIIVGAAV